MGKNSEASEETPAVSHQSRVPRVGDQVGSLGDFWRSPLVRFILVGGFCAVLDGGSTLFMRFILDMSDNWSKNIGFILGTLMAYLINRRWTFNAAPSKKRFVITMITYGLTYVVQKVLFHASIPWLESFGLNAFWVRLFSFIIAQGVATIVNFLIQRFLIFRVKEEENTSAEAGAAAVNH